MAFFSGALVRFLPMGVSFFFCWCDFPLQKESYSDDTQLPHLRERTHLIGAVIHVLAHSLRLLLSFAGFHYFDNDASGQISSGPCDIW